MKKALKFIASAIISLLFISLIVYFVISVWNIVPFGWDYLKGKYFTDNNLFPNYSSVYNSIFTIISILLTSFFSYLVYSNNREQKNYNYNKEVVNNAATTYYYLKYIILSSYKDILKENEENISDCDYYSKQGKQKCYDILFDAMPKLYHSKLEENAFSIIGLIKEENLRERLFFLLQDIKAYANISYVLKDEIIQGENLIEFDAKKLVEVLYDIDNDKYIYLEDTYGRLMNKLKELSEYKK